MQVGSDNRKTTARRSPTNISRFRARSVGYSSQSPVIMASIPPKVLSNPNVINIRKNIMDQKLDNGIVAIASGYTINTKPGPEKKQNKDIHVIHNVI